MSDKNRGPIIIGNIRAGRSVNISDGPMVVNNADNDRGQRDGERSDGEDVNISTYRNGKRTDDDEE